MQNIIIDLQVTRFRLYISTEEEARHPEAGHHNSVIFKVMLKNSTFVMHVTNMSIQNLSQELPPAYFYTQPNT
jgi:hypothetical protein